MSEATFGETELDRLAREVEDQLAELRVQPKGLFKSVDAPKPTPEKQMSVIANAAGQDPMTFFEAFKKAAREDICDAGGIFHERWTKYKDVAKRDLVAFTIGVLSLIGVSAAALPIVAVAVVVWLLFVGIDAYREWSA